MTKKRVLKVVVFALVYVLLAELYTMVLTSNNPEAKLVQELLAKKYYGEVMDAKEVGWVKPVNITLWIGFGGWAPNPIHGENLSVLPAPFVLGEDCVIGWFEDDPMDERGTIQVRGETTDRVLYEYSVRDSSGQTPCPSGTLFFAKKGGAR